MVRWAASNLLGPVTAYSHTYNPTPHPFAPPRTAGTLLDFMRAMVFHLYRWPLERVLPLMTSSPAAALRLPAKGQLAPGCDADLLLLDAASLELRYVLARGEVVRTPDWVRGSYFEKGPGVRPRRPAGQ